MDMLSKFGDKKVVKVGLGVLLGGAAVGGVFVGVRVYKKRKEAAKLKKVADKLNELQMNDK